MAMKKGPLARVRLVYCRSSILVKCVVLATIVLCTVTLLTLRASILNNQAQADALRDQAAVMEQENQKLEDKITALGTVQSIKQIAKEELGLVDPGAVFYTPEK